jgi:hypothetical protein
MCEVVNSIMGRCKAGVVQWQEAVSGAATGNGQPSPTFMAYDSIAPHACQPAKHSMNRNKD